MTKATILLAEDDNLVRSITAQYLQLENYLVLEATNGKEAMEILNSEKVDLVILNIIMPVLNGWQVCEKIKKRKNIPIILVSGKIDENDRIKIFELGVEQYMTKPVSNKELVIRIDSLLKKKGIGENECICFKDILINKNMREVYLNGKVINLTLKEYEILLLLVINKNKVIKRKVIIEKVWGEDLDEKSRVIDTLIKRLRRKLGKARTYITTIWGTGYSIRD